MRPGLRGPLGASAAGQTLPRPLPVMQLLDTGGETGVTPRQVHTLKRSPPCRRGCTGRTRSGFGAAEGAAALPR